MSPSPVKLTLPPTPLQLSPSQFRVKVAPGDKWILPGTSGCGKTTALKYLDAAYKRLWPGMRHFVLDSKMDGDFDGWPNIIQSDKAPRKSNQQYQVWQPVTLLPSEIEKWLEMIFYSGPSVLEIDELVHLCYKPNVYSDWYNKILKLGRSKKIGVITLTQEFSKIPPNAYKQSTHRLGFYIDDSAEYDIRVRNNLLKAKVPNPPEGDPYGFYYQHKDQRGKPQYYPSIQKFFGM